MADKTIGELTPALNVGLTDLFVLEQNNTAKSLTGQRLESWLLELADGHGGIQSIAKTSESGLVDTYTITYADTTTSTFTVTNGKAIQSIVTYFAVSSSDTTVPTYWYPSRQTMTPTDRFLWSHLTITYNDGTLVSTTSSVIGVYGDKGETGETGNGIEDLTQTGRVPGQYTVYTFTMTNGATKTFLSYDGAGIADIAKTSTDGLEDTYTVTLTDGSTSTFTVTNAKSIVNIAWTSNSGGGTQGDAGTTDIYTITYNDGDTSTFSVYNGANGTGSVSTVDGIAAVGQNVPLLTIGNGPPSTTTQGNIKSRYFDATNSILYFCTSIDTSTNPTTYTWKGSGVTVDSSLSSMSTNPVQNRAIYNKFGTLETSIASKFPYSGGTMNGNIVMANHKITNLGAPTANGDAVNKSYVDSNYRTASAQDAIDIGMAKADEVGIVITGARPSTTVTTGQYVIVRNSTISGISDGLYTANNTLSPSVDVTAADLSAVSEGGLNMVTPISLGGTGAASAFYARQNLETVFSRRYVAGGGATITLSLTSNQAFLLIAAGTIATKHGLYIVSKPNSDTATPLITTVFAASGLVITAGPGTITIENSAGSAATLIAMTSASNANLPIMV